MTTIERDTAVQRLARTAARHRVDDRELERDIFRAAHDGGMTHKQISDVVGTLSQATVQRTLRKVSENPSRLRETPGEMIDRRRAGLIDDETMMSRLLSWEYSFGHVPSVDGVATDAYLSGDWDEIELAYYRDLLSDDEFARLVERQKENLERAAHTR